jgi:hypothetical protein
MKAYELKITLKNTHPPVWRRCIIPHGLTFAQLTVVLNRIMGWHGNQSYNFIFPSQEIFIAEGRNAYPVECQSKGLLDGASTCADRYIESNPWFVYTYGLDRNWEHRVTVECILPDCPDEYPQILKYRGDCPDEDSSINQHSHNDQKDCPVSTTPYDLDEVNRMLESTCFLIPSTAETRTAAEIDKDLSQGRVGLYYQPVNPKVSKKHCSSNTAVPPLSDYAPPTVPDSRKWSMTLEESLNYYTKKSLVLLAKKKNISIRISDKKDVLLQKILQIMLDPNVIQSYLLCLNNHEIKKLDLSIVPDKPVLGLTEKDFQILYKTGYVAKFQEIGLVVPVELADQYRKLKSPNFSKKRRRRNWLISTLDTAAILYGIAPIDILVRLYNSHKKYQITREDFLQEIGTLPPELREFTIHQDMFYANGLWPDNNGLWKSQGDTPFYIPPYKQLTDFSQIMVPNLKYIIALTDYFFQTLKMDENSIAILFDRLAILSMSDTPIEEIMCFLHSARVLPKDFPDETMLQSLLTDFSDNTRKLLLRGFTPHELAVRKKGAEKKGNIIYVNNWNRK